MSLRCVSIAFASSSNGAHSFVRVTSERKPSVVHVAVVLTLSFRCVSIAVSPAVVNVHEMRSNALGTFVSSPLFPPVVWSLNVSFRTYIVVVYAHLFTLSSLRSPPYAHPFSASISSADGPCTSMPWTTFALYFPAPSSFSPFVSFLLESLSVSYLVGTLVHCSRRRRMPCIGLLFATDRVVCSMLGGILVAQPPRALWGGWVLAMPTRVRPCVCSFLRDRQRWPII